jgi:hypothetical protein
MKLSPIASLSRASVKSARRALLISLFLSSALADIGCQHIGPKTVVDDRLAYNKAILKSWEQQTLLNIVRVRYDDLVSFVDVGPVAQTHSLMGTTGASFGSSIFPWNTIMNTLMPGLSGSRATTDSPIITYTPLTGAEFARNLTSPLKPSEICNLIESGYKADVLLNLTLKSINDIPNSEPNVYPKDAKNRFRDFTYLTKAIECAVHRHSGDLNFPVQSGTDGDRGKAFMTIADQDSETGCDTDLPNSPVAYIREKLHLKAAAKQFEIVAGSRPTTDTEIAVRTRSVIGAMRWLSSYVQVPEAHVKKFDIKKNLYSVDPPLKVEAHVEKPSDPFAAIQYHDYWFSIPKDASSSKFSLIYLRTLLALADTAAKPSPPVLTIPTR